jgi:glycosyltransferase involved in cell wall biosynthesis
VVRGEGLSLTPFPIMQPLASPRVAVVIPALNEQDALPHVLRDIPSRLVCRVVVADNGSTDRTAEVARAHGAEVVHEPERGYGAACLKALAHLAADPPDIVVFLDGDYSDHPNELPTLIDPIVAGDADMVIGSRARGRREQGALSLQQRVGNAIACSALRLLYGVGYTDLGPFRAIRWDTLAALGMQDRNYGWTVEMQIKAAQRGIAYREIPVSYRQRIGVSKVSGTIRGSVSAGAKILWLLGRYTWS